MALPNSDSSEDICVPLNRSSSTVAPGSASRVRRRPFVALLVLATAGVATGHVGAASTDEAAGQSVSASSAAGPGTSQSAREAVAERVIVRMARLDLARLTAAEFADAETPVSDNRDQLP